ncbi:alpha/beta fold hydrolase [Fluviispira multicolorata]|uniref:Alpha/beta fold hydrolase n=1 Tax=Fluviispira multicolorata TaxID=2654512 RepID=A0A833JC86_9BACT|nr:alpha/beta hydrolase [Fluviispira multicolorata]KAB8030691.1 alpha/beta fold hydrolase [Fluviispira multicolorata]
MKPTILYYKLKESTAKVKVISSPIVLIRGLGRSMGFWLEFEDEILKYCDIILIDLLGTGGSKSRVGRSCIKDFAEDVKLTLEQLSIKNVHLCGMSLGGMVVIELAKLFSKEKNININVKSICIMASSSAGFKQKRINKKPMVKLLLAIFLSFGISPPKHKILSRYLVSKNTLSKHENIVDKWDELWKIEGFSHLAILRQLYAAARYKANLENSIINYPCLFIVSKHDELVPWTNSISLWHSFPNSKLCVLENLGHDLTTDDPILLAQTLCNFYKDITDKG